MQGRSKRCLCSSKYMNLHKVLAEKAELAPGDRGQSLRLGQLIKRQLYLAVFKQEVRYG